MTSLRSLLCYSVLGILAAWGFAHHLSDRNVAAAHEPIEAKAECALAPFSFLVGTWQGEMGGQFIEEIWSSPRDGAMMGMFRWLNDEGRPRMYELLTISREGDETYLRLRHFTAELTAWEEKDAPVVLRLESTAPGRVAFENVSAEDRLVRIVFFEHDQERLGIDVEFRAETERPPLRFRLVRASN